MPIPPGMKRRTVDVPEEHIEAMTKAQGVDGVPISPRLRAMVEVWISDESVRAQVDQEALRIWETTRRRRQAPLDAANRQRQEQAGD